MGPIPRGLLVPSATSPRAPASPARARDSRASPRLPPARSSARFRAAGVRAVARALARVLDVAIAVGAERTSPVGASPARRATMRPRAASPPGRRLARILPALLVVALASCSIAPALAQTSQQTSPAPFHAYAPPVAPRPDARLGRGDADRLGARSTASSIAATSTSPRMSRRARTSAASVSSSSSGARTRRRAAGSSGSFAITVCSSA